MPFSRTAETTTLISQIDTAMARADDIGNDMIRDLMPELRDTIDEINAALREVDELLFEGLRDEAVTLHDEDFPILASRLNLEDREGSPELEQFFIVEGISPPPKIDYDTLSALESAHAELEELRRPLDKLRRLALERAPLARRLALLRKLRESDPKKPVWTQAINDHEEARLAELHQEVRAVLARRDPDAVATLHAELVDPDWGIPVPRELVRATRGAELWTQLRAAAAQARDAGLGLQAAWQELQQGPPAIDLVDRLRGLRQQYDQAVRVAAENTPPLGDCPTVAGLVGDERLVEQIDAVAAQASEPLNWLALRDADDASVAQLQQVCGQLEYRCHHKPSKAAESAWLADVRRLTDEAERLSQLQPSPLFSDVLRDTVAQATAEIIGRAKRRRQVLIGSWVAGIVALVLLIFGVASWWWKSSADTAAIRTLEAFQRRAATGEFADLPVKVKTVLLEHPDDERFKVIGAAIDELVQKESTRRSMLQTLLQKFDEQLQSADVLFEARKGAERIEAWPPSVVEAAKLWREADRVGGREEADEPPSQETVVGRLREAEEEDLQSRRRGQVAMESKYEEASVEYVRTLVEEIDEAADRATSLAEIEQLQNQIRNLMDIFRLEKTPDVDLLLDRTSKRRFPPAHMEFVKRIEKKLEVRGRELERAGGTKPRTEPAAGSESSLPAGDDPKPEQEDPVAGGDT